MKANNVMQKDFHKLLNNGVYGKTSENQPKRNTINLVTENRMAERLAALARRPHDL